MVIFPGADGEIEQTLALFHLFFDGFVLFLHHRRRERAYRFKFHQAHEFGVMRPFGFDLGMRFVVNRPKADILCFKQLRLNV